MNFAQLPQFIVVILFALISISNSIPTATINEVTKANLGNVIESGVNEIVGNSTQIVPNPGGIIVSVGNMVNGILGSIFGPIPQQPPQPGQPQQPIPPQQPAPAPVPAPAQVTPI
ncbi:hypothetical protein BKA69DRAFT_1169321 [Paraphysoderma sedebokerense]|nr:hypothetical protein BKA69DRAFT_1169321 [Paraphysoderma sedebokerense]